MNSKMSQNVKNSRISRIQTLSRDFLIFDFLIYDLSELVVLVYCLS